jgi:hypothetical protein
MSAVSASCCIGLASGISRCVRVTRRRIVRRSRRIKNFAALVADAIPPEACGKPLELWWQDEARIGQQGSLTYIWAEQGTRPPAPRDQRYDWAYIFGAVCPVRGVGAALVLPEANAEAMNRNRCECRTAVSVDGSPRVPCLASRIP